MVSHYVRLQAFTDTLKFHLGLKFRAIAVIQSLTHANAELVLRMSFHTKTKHIISVYLVCFLLQCSGCLYIAGLMATFVFICLQEHSCSSFAGLSQEAGDFPKCDTGFI